MSDTAASSDLMDRIYRRQRHLYDSTRKYYLLGRDRLIERLSPPAGGRVLEIGCGTARNLVSVARRYPEAPLFGIDISSEMLISARQTVAREGLASRIRLAQADATRFDPDLLFGVPSFSRIFISYSLSMIPEWRAGGTAALVPPRPAPLAGAISCRSARWAGSRACCSRRPRGRAPHLRAASSRLCAIRGVPVCLTG